MKSYEELEHISNLLILQVGMDGVRGEIFKLGKRFCSVIWSFGGGWEHVSIAPYKRSYVPSWEDMCTLKDMFFRDDETVVQFHPAKSEYVNNVSNCLHLWRPIKEKLPTPPSIMVGVREGQTMSEVEKVIQDMIQNMDLPPEAETEIKNLMREDGQTMVEAAKEIQKSAQKDGSMPRYAKGADFNAKSCKRLY